MSVKIRNQLNPQFLMQKPKQLFLFLSLFWGMSSSLQAQTARLDDFRKNLPEGMLISFAAKSGASGKTLTWQKARRIPSASTIKIPLLVVLLEEVENQRLQLDQVHILQIPDIVGGAGDLQKQQEGKAFTLDFLAREMIRTSDNTATNILLSYVSMEKVNARMKALGLSQTTLQRLMMDFKAIEEGRQNYTSPEDMVRLMEKLYNGEVLSANSKEYFLSMLLACEDDSMLTQAFPEKSIAHKTGTLDYVRADVGIVMGESPVYMALFAENFKNMEHAEALLRDLAVLLWEELGEN